MVVDARDPLFYRCPDLEVLGFLILVFFLHFKWYITPKPNKMMIACQPL
jgi:hypothetical protein